MREALCQEIYIPSRKSPLPAKLTAPEDPLPGELGHRVRAHIQDHGDLTGGHAFLQVLWIWHQAPLINRNVLNDPGGCEFNAVLQQ